MGAPMSPEFDGLSSVRFLNNVLFVFGVAFSSIAWSPKGKDVDIMVDLSPTDAVGLLNEDDICVDNGLSLAGIPKENNIAGVDVGAASALCFSTLSGNNDIPHSNLLITIIRRLDIGREFVLVGVGEGLLDDKLDGAFLQHPRIGKKLGTIVVWRRWC